jgi:hypothetical protein
LALLLPVSAHRPRARHARPGTLPGKATTGRSCRLGLVSRERGFVVSWTTVPIVARIRRTAVTGAAASSVRPNAGGSTTCVPQISPNHLLLTGFEPAPPA